jgi:hypothetical protein
MQTATLPDNPVIQEIHFDQGTLVVSTEVISIKFHHNITTEKRIAIHDILSRALLPDLGNPHAEEHVYYKRDPYDHRENYVWTVNIPPAKVLDALRQKGQITAEEQQHTSAALGIKDYLHKGRF